YSSASLCTTHARFLRIARNPQSAGKKNTLAPPHIAAPLPLRHGSSSSSRVPSASAIRRGTTPPSRPAPPPRSPPPIPRPPPSLNPLCRAPIIGSSVVVISTSTVVESPAPHPRPRRFSTPHHLPSTLIANLLLSATASARIHACPDHAADATPRSQLTNVVPLPPAPHPTLSSPFGLRGFASVPHRHENGWADTGGSWVK
ncbi:Os10g0161100, partial [Oryza sativa Japonica Group]